MVIGEQELLAAAVVPELARSAMSDLKNALLALYTNIPQVLSCLIKVFNGISRKYAFQKNSFQEPALQVSLTNLSHYIST